VLDADRAARHADELLDILPCRDQDGGASGNVINAVLAPPVTVDFKRLTRHVFSSSSCGVCGKATLDAILQVYPPVPPGADFDAHQLASLPERLRAAQPTFAATGGLHATGLFSSEGDLLVVREDVGRHNAMDKVVGWAFGRGLLPLSDKILCVSGRLSFELAQKAAVAGCPVLVAVGAPSSLAVDLASDRGLTLCGFVRDGSVNVYTESWRITG